MEERRLQRRSLTLDHRELLLLLFFFLNLQALFHLAWFFFCLFPVWKTSEFVPLGKESK